MLSDYCVTCQRVQLVAWDPYFYRWVCCECDTVVKEEKPLSDLNPGVLDYQI
jgi:hypothetical protein